ncbi:MAG: polyprenyl diphosphate synthase [Candidatus Saccharimonadales bacterium]
MTANETLTVPRHVGIIMDGNRRWAKSQGLPTLEGHRRGAETFKDIALQSFERGVEYVSAYVFSAENWQRTEDEVGYLMNLVVKAVDKYLEEFNERGIKIVILGRREGLRRKVIDAIKHTEAQTKDNKTGTLALCLNYSGHDEIEDAAAKVLSSGATIKPESIRQNLYHPEIPDLDFIIRTSGEQRLSGFMLHRAAYAELYFTTTLWPAFTCNDMDNALDEYGLRKRRFGS